MRWAFALLSIPWLAACNLVFPLESAGPPSCPLEFAGARYIAIQATQPWAAAKDACEELKGVNMYSHLAIVSDPAEAALMSDFITADAWVGLTDLHEMTFRWITTERTIGMPWIGTQPDDPTRSEGNCGRVLRDGSGLADGPCETDERPAVCECDEFPVDGSRF
ncbi:MAG TPA: C-type lectin domain-containing protein [Kofleriaceae bacterium]